MNPDNSMREQALPAEVNDMFTEKLITAQDVEPLLNLRDTLIGSAPKARAGFQSQLALRLEAEITQQHYSMRRIRMPKSLTARILLVVVAVLTVGVGGVLAVNSILRQFISYDAGLNAAFTSGNSVQLNQSQTVGNYTLNLQWANADSNRLTLGFTLAGFACPVEYVVCGIKVKLVSQSGQEIPMIDGRADDSHGVYTYLYNFNLASRNVDHAFRLEIEPYGMTNDGTDPDQPNVIRGHTVMLGEPIRLDFSAAVNNQVRVFSTLLSATDHDIPVTLRRVMVSPTQTRVVVCFVPPAPERSWTTIPHLTTRDGDVAGGAVNYVSGVGESSGEICNEHLYNAALFDYTGDWTLEITELVGFGKQGSDQQRIAGSWEFQFKVP